MSVLAVFASCAVVATALAQIFTNTYQKSLECDAMQLLYHTSPLIALVRAPHETIIRYISARSYWHVLFQGMLCMSPVFDDLAKLQTFEYTYRCKLNIG